MQAMPQAPQLSCLLHIQQSARCFDSQHKKTTPLQQTLHYTLTIHSKHVKCHKSNYSQNSLSLWLSHRHCCCHSFAAVPPTASPVPQQPNHVVCHIILWLAGVVPFSTNRNMFFLLANTSCLRTLSWEKPVFIVSSCNKSAANVTVMFAKKRSGHYLS